jgi:hypothetical protein
MAAKKLTEAQKDVLTKMQEGCVIPIHLGKYSVGNGMGFSKSVSESTVAVLSNLKKIVRKDYSTYVLAQPF